MIAKLLNVTGALVMLGVIGYFALPRLVCTEIPKQQKLADCNSNPMAFTLTCDHSPPYQFVLGLGPTHSGPIAFHGEVIIQQSTGRVARIQIASDHITPCNWLAEAGLDGYILTWGRTNAGERLGELLRQGQSYDVRVAFSEAPPADSSLWFSSTGRAKLW
jgi:hypothetical protein